MGRIRRAAAAGSFYPDDPEALRQTVVGLLEPLELEDGAKPPKALIAPHAGYPFSGVVAAEAFAFLEPLREQVRRVVLLGPAHYAGVRGLAVPSWDSFATPLGNVPVDRDAVGKLAELEFVAVDDRAHAPEHCLEVELPFLQCVLGDFALVPILVGLADPEEVAMALDRVWGGPETVIVVSSDLSHWHDANTARRLDQAAARAIEQLRPEDLTEESACGRWAIAGLLIAARRRHLTARTLDLRNSGDTAGSRDGVVGYGAWVFA